MSLWGRELPEADLAELYHKTEGWAAGLVLMLEHSLSSANIDLVPTSRAPQVVFDYLAGEIFQNFDERTRHLLLKTAFVPAMTSTMAESITGDADADAILTRLHHGHLFVSLKADGPETIFFGSSFARGPGSRSRRASTAACDVPRPRFWKRRARWRRRRSCCVKTATSLS